jgi:O-antigen/teichoic acid export membrane protein
MGGHVKGLGLRKLLANIATTLGRQLASGLLQFLTVVAIARVYGAEGNGIYSVALLLPTTIATLLNLGVGPANVYFLGAKKVATRAAWRSTLMLFFCISIVGLSVGSFVLIYGAGKLFPTIPISALWVALLTFPVTLLLSLISSFFQGLQKFDKFNIVVLQQPLLTLIFTLSLAFWGAKNIEWQLWAYCGGSVVALALALNAIKPYLKMGTDQVFEGYGRAVVKYGYKAHIANILAFINYKIDLFLVNFFLGPVSTGIYAVAVQFAERLWLISQAVSTVLLPKLSELSSAEEKRRLLTPFITRWVLWLTLLGSVGLMVVVLPVIEVFFGKKFIGAISPLLFLTPGIVLGSASRILANDFAARGRPELNMYTSWLVVTVNISANIVLIPRLGIRGAAIATTIAYSLNFGMRLFMHNRVARMPILENVLIRRQELIGVVSALRGAKLQRESRRNL